jgi:excinuclease UvrABC nuclease subunit
MTKKRANKEDIVENHIDDTPRNKSIRIKIISSGTNISADNIYIIPNCYGTYIVTDELGYKYVGASNSIRNRILSHGFYRTNPQIVGPIRSIDYYETEDMQSAKILEYYFIRKLNPRLNREFKY